MIILLGAVDLRDDTIGLLSVTGHQQKPGNQGLEDETVLFGLCVQRTALSRIIHSIDPSPHRMKANQQPSIHFCSYHCALCCNREDLQ